MRGKSWDLKRRYISSLIAGSSDLDRITEKIRRKHGWDTLRRLFNPNYLSPSVWYDLSDPGTLYKDAGSTLVTADGDAIYQVNDKSSNGLNLTQSTLNARPAYKIGIQNGRSIARFITDDFLSGGDVLNALTGSTVFVVVKANAVPGGASFGLCNKGIGLATDREFGFILIDGGSSDVKARNIVADQSLALVEFADSPAFNTGSYVVAAGSFTGSEVSGFINGTEGTPAATTVVIEDLTANFEVGRLLSAGSYLNGDIGEIIIYPYSLTTTQFQTTCTYLEYKWGI